MAGFQDVRWLHVLRRRPVAGLASALAAFGVFGAMGAEILERRSFVFDKWVLWRVRSLASPGLDVAMPLITSLGSYFVIGPITVLVALLLLLDNQRRPAAVIAISTAGAATLSWASKLFYLRPRPDLWSPLVIETSHSFPSGHAMASTAFAVSAFFMAWSGRYRWLAIVLAPLFVVAIGFSRLYLGVHYPSDVLAGCLFAFAWSTLVAVTLSKR